MHPRFMRDLLLLTQDIVLSLLALIVVCILTKHLGSFGFRHDFPSGYRIRRISIRHIRCICAVVSIWLHVSNR